MEHINIVFASDEHFIRYTAVTLASILYNFTGDNNLNIFILTDKPLSDNLFDKVRRLDSIKSFNLYNIVVDADSFSNIRTTPGISLATYFRLVMHDALPTEMARCIYLDSDIIVRKSLSEVYDVDMEECMFAGVEDSISRVYNRKFGARDDAPHINAGVAIVNLQLVRSRSFTKIINDYLDIYRYLITLGDQQIINGAFSEFIRYIPITWNVHGSMFSADWRKKHAGISNSFSLNEIDSAVADPAVIHYTYARKPWVSMEHPWSSEWWDYAVKTSFFADVDKPTNPKSQVKNMKDAKNKSKSSIIKRINGYLLSIFFLRTMRLKLNNLEIEFNELKKHTGRRIPYFFLEMQSAELLRSISTRRSTNEFDAHSLVSSRAEHLKILTNGEPRDLDGGYHENLKTIFKTPEIRRTLDLSETNSVLILVQRLRQEFFWKALYAACYYGKELLFAETSFFGAFATYNDEEAPALLRKSFGYILDDKGYYFDARNPSRLEEYLNSNKSILSIEETARSLQLIGKIIDHGITKYNYSTKAWIDVELPPKAVLVVDQKANDASIEFAAAGAKTFEVMMTAACNENPGANVYLKAHPDNLGRSRRQIDPRVHVLTNNCRITKLLDQCDKVYVVSSQVGFEAILRGKEVHCFGLPFYAGWGLTLDRQKLARRTRRVTKEELFHAACIRHSVYVQPLSGSLMELEDALDFIIDKRGEANHSG